MKAADGVFMRSCVSLLYDDVSKCKCVKRDLILQKQVCLMVAPCD